jgi:hypothetical protein
MSRSDSSTSCEFICQKYYRNLNSGGRIAERKGCRLIPTRFCQRSVKHAISGDPSWFSHFYTIQISLLEEQSLTKLVLDELDVFQSPSLTYRKEVVRNNEALHNHSFKSSDEIRVTKTGWEWPADAIEVWLLSVHLLHSNQSVWQDNRVDNGIHWGLTGIFKNWDWK